MLRFRLSPAFAGSDVFMMLSWGLRPRLYADACSAGYAFTSEENKMRVRTSHKHSVARAPFKLTALFSLVLVLGCETSKFEPVALAPEDMCAYCKMAVSEKRYAAELIDAEGQLFKFDDIGCMTNFLKNRKSTPAIKAYFVMDFEERTWIKAADASYVHSPELSTPMNGGIIAFRDQTKAKEAADRYHGKLLRFEDVLATGH
ncbi:MAG TPA: nitrous oxide reductase accessory protein NosL [Pyrinomonadaceae bacterium]|jgi:copper chaperone NosL|nr:nitrous oxide reductase accessory protein NosL [Pyrinomonadaceae bacterium]